MNCISIPAPVGYLFSRFVLSLAVAISAGCGGGDDNAIPAFTLFTGITIADLDGDGDLDLMLHFRNQETGIASGATEACLTGTLLDGTPFEACDTILTVPLDAYVQLSLD